jgi:hypothetical protein
MNVHVLPAMHFTTEAWRLWTPTKIKNCFVKCGSQLIKSGAMTSCKSKLRSRGRRKTQHCTMGRVSMCCSELQCVN